MFKEGDELICISDDLYNEQNVLIMKKYEKCIFLEYFGRYNEYLTVNLKNNEMWSLESKDFVTLKEYRKLKLNKLCLK